MAFLAFHKTVRNDGDEDQTFQFWICTTKQDAIDHLLSVWEQLEYEEEELQETSPKFKNLLEQGTIIWKHEWKRKRNGDLFGVLKIDKTNNFSIELDKLMENAFTIDGEKVFDRYSY